MTPAILLLLAALTQTPKTHTSAPPRDPMAEAMKDLDAGKPQQAIATLKEVLEQNPDNYGVWFNLGIAYSMAGQDDEAVTSFRKVLTLEPKLYEAQLNLAQVLLRQKKYADATEFLKQAVEQKPQEIRPQLMLGKVLLAIGKPAEAEARFRAVTALDAKQAEAFLLLSRSLSAQQRWADAAEPLTRYTELTPADTAAQMELAQTLEKAKKPAEAAAIYRRFPKDPVAMERAGVLELDAGNAKQSVEELTLAVQTSPTPALRYALATALLRSGEIEKAAEVAAALVSQTPDHFDARMFYGRLLRDQKKYAPAAEQFSSAAKLKPNSLEAWNELTAMLVILKNYPAALETLEKSKQLGGETAAYYWYRAIMLDAEQDHKPALESYTRFLEMSQGKSPDEEFKARQRVRILTRIVNR
ncbi:MAG: tetratricopeptide repeat protein [Bryobacteraceae bacterium]|nr:tetratricopeptide repeat protein [Bryobacteraceae bacterium]